MKNPTTRYKITTLAIMLILPIAALLAQTVIHDLRSAEVIGQTDTLTNAPTVTTTPANEWTRTPPPDEPFGTPPAWIAMRFDGPVEIFAPVTPMGIKHPVYGYAVRPGNWHWRRIDGGTRALMLGATMPATEPDRWAEFHKMKARVYADEIADLKARIFKATAALNTPTPSPTPSPTPESPATAKE